MRNITSAQNSQRVSISFGHHRILPFTAFEIPFSYFGLYTLQKCLMNFALTPKLVEADEELMTAGGLIGVVERHTQFVLILTVHRGQLLVRSRFSASLQIPAVYETRCSLSRFQEPATYSHPVFLHRNVFHSH